MRQTFHLIAVALALAAAVCGCSRDESAKASIDVTEARATDIEKAIKDQKGKVVLVDCWATWCAPCVKKFPHLVATHKKYAEKGLVCMSISMDKLGDPDAYGRDKVLRFLKDKDATFPNLIVAEPKKDDAELTKLLGDWSIIPYMVLFDRNGRRVWESDQLPKLSDGDLDKKIEALMADQP